MRSFALYLLWIKTTTKYFLSEFPVHVRDMSRYFCHIFCRVNSWTVLYSVLSFSWVVSYWFCSFYFCLFSSCRCLYCLLCTCSLAVCVLVIVGFNSKQENKHCRFSFVSLSCIQFCRLDVDSINYKKLAFGFNSDYGFARDTEHN